MSGRERWELTEPPGGYAPPWPAALALTAVLPPGSWTLVGGLMVQLHALKAGLDPTRPTQDVDVLLHIETDRITWPSAQAALIAAGYRLDAGMAKDSLSHRFRRDADVLDVLIADHVGPWAISARTGAQPLVSVPGGTSALRKTVDCVVRRLDGTQVTISVPNVLGALTLKGGAYREDPRDRDRHLEDGAVLAATVDDADDLRERHELWTGSDARRIAALARKLPDQHPAWSQVPRERRARAQVSLQLLALGPSPQRQQL